MVGVLIFSPLLSANPSLAKLVAFVSCPGSSSAPGLLGEQRVAGRPSKVGANGTTVFMPRVAIAGVRPPPSQMDRQWAETKNRSVGPDF